MERNTLQLKLDRLVRTSGKVNRRAETMTPIAAVKVTIYADDYAKEDLSLSIPVFKARGGGYLSVLEDMFTPFASWLTDTSELKATVDLTESQTKLLTNLERATLKDGKFSFNIMSLVPLLGGLKTSVPVIIEVNDVVSLVGDQLSTEELRTIRELHNNIYQTDISILSKELLQRPEANRMLSAAQDMLMKNPENVGKQLARQALPGADHIDISTNW